MISSNVIVFALFFHTTKQFLKIIANLSKFYIVIVEILDL